ncbi:hypothetical protein BASA81_008654 [Batrachochytrium salamandrivorans]|nr:hypothetical protein BASA81_008654 [Batrachochytrium salamandrivorans]
MSIPRGLAGRWRESGLFRTRGKHTHATTTNPNSNETKTNKQSKTGSKEDTGTQMWSSTRSAEDAGAVLQLRILLDEDEDEGMPL